MKLFTNKNLLITLSVAILAIGIFISGILLGWYGEHHGPGAIAGAEIPPAVISDRQKSIETASSNLNTQLSKQILFGDLHVHTTFSSDAFRMSLPMVGGDGAHPPADACDYARYCSSVDFWSINDHAESLTPRHWQEIKDSVRQCAAVSGDPNNPDVVPFVGFEWTQAALTADQHYGHKNVMFLDLEDDKLPARPIATRGMDMLGNIPMFIRVMPSLYDFGNRQQYYDFDTLARELTDVPACPDGVNTRDLPVNCMERAKTSAQLFKKLDEWGFDTIVIPHGNTWGIYTPPGVTWDKQLVGDAHDPDKQTLIEMYSGHGNSEEYRPWTAMIEQEDGTKICPKPSPNYMPGCWRAGEIIKERCESDGLEAKTCKAREIEARDNFLEMGMSGFLSVPGATIPDWLNSGQCEDCYLPSFKYRPGGSAQYALAISNFDDPKNPKRFRFGIIASSDNHSGRAASGYKELNRTINIDGWSYGKKWADELFNLKPKAPVAQSQMIDRSTLKGFSVLEIERQTSFLTTGGLVAAHTKGRDRVSIWNSLKAKEVYGTSGERMLLWFDLLNPEGVEDKGVAPMGSEVIMGETPRFQVRAVGAFKQKPGCPDYSVDGLNPERLQSLCRGECYNPSDERKLITRIEIVRILPQITPNEDVNGLIEDVWKSYDCPPDANGCVFEFDDPAYTAGNRDAVYYARAIQEPSPMINAGNLRCEYGEDGLCKKVNPCYGGHKTSPDDNCLAPKESRAWSSPIFVDYPTASKE